MAYGYVYITTNLINGKRYIGQSSYKRKINHDCYLGSGKAIKKAIVKYGRENFSREVVFIAETREELTSKEIELISQYNAVEDPSWYNIAAGGYTTRGFLGRKHSPESIAKKRANYRRGPLSEQGKQNIGNATKRDKRWLIAAKARRECTGENHHRSKPVVFDGITYPSILDAVKHTTLTFYHARKLAISQAAS